MKTGSKPILNIVKIGGKLIEDEKTLQAFLQDFSQMRGYKILVHGGGVLATQLAESLGYPNKMVDGRRITDKDSLKVAVMTYAGLLNKSVVAGLQSNGCRSLGLCGADGGSILAVKRPVKDIDYGFVGDVVAVDSEFLASLLQSELTPVFSAITCTREGQLLNTNADSIATEIAKAMVSRFEVSLFFCMEKKGVLLDTADENSVIQNLNTEKYQELVDSKVITEGMLPKLQNCFQALDHNISAIFLGDRSIIQGVSEGTKITK